MQGYFYGSKKEIPADFDDYFDAGDTAVVEMDMCAGTWTRARSAPVPSPAGGRSSRR